MITNHLSDYSIRKHDTNRFIFLTFLLFINACSTNTDHTNKNSNKDHIKSGGTRPENTIEKPALFEKIGIKPVNTTYMPTGFYFLAEKGKGVNMLREKSNEIYTISPLPFASVENISKTKLEKTHLNESDYTELCMTFDNKGTKDLAEGTGNPLHPKIAVVVANRLLYVVDNTAPIKTGVMCGGLVGYSDEEMKIMQISPDNKR